MNLIRADLYRIFKDKVLYILIAALAALSLIVGYTYQLLEVQGVSTLGDILLKCIGADTLCTVLGIATALFVGRDYTENTIRSKLTRGEGRYKVFFSKLIEGYILALIFFAAAAGTGAVAGLLWYEHAVSADFWKILFCQLAIVLAFSSVITTLAVYTKSTRVPLITTIVLFVVLNPVALFLPGMEETPLIRALCRGLYPVTSNMLLASKGGVYQAVSTSMSEGVLTTAVTEFSGMYANALSVAGIYTAAAVVIALLAVRRQEYK